MRSDDRERLNMNKLMVLLASTALASVVAFENKAGWKKKADGSLEVNADGNPIYVTADGQEMVTEAGTVQRFTDEAKQHRIRAEKAEADLLPFKGIDPVKAKEAIEKLGKIDQKTLIDAGEVDRVRAEISNAFTAQIDELKAANGTLAQDRDNLIRSNAFSNSEFIRDRVAVPREMFEKTFGDQFKVEDGKLVPYDRNGNPVMSKKRVGERAEVDEAFEIIVDNYPHKETILKANAGAGSGNGGGGGGRGPGRFVKRADFEKMNPIDQAATAAAMGKGELQVVD